MEEENNENEIINEEENSKKGYYLCAIGYVLPIITAFTFYMTSKLSLALVFVISFIISLICVTIAFKKNNKTLHNLCICWFIMAAIFIGIVLVVFVFIVVPGMLCNYMCGGLSG